MGAATWARITANKNKHAILEGVTIKNVTPSINKEIVLTPGEETIVEFPGGVRNLLIKNTGGVVYVNFDDKIADASEGFPLNANESLTGIKCNRLRMFSTSMTTVNILGGE